jgi:hypothetical protein
MAICILTCKTIIVTSGTCTPLMTRTDCYCFEVGILIKYWFCTNCSISGTCSSWVTPIAYPFPPYGNQWIKSFDSWIIHWVHFRIHRYKRWYYNVPHWVWYCSRLPCYQWCNMSWPTYMLINWYWIGNQIQLYQSLLYMYINMGRWCAQYHMLQRSLKCLSH